MEQHHPSAAPDDVAADAPADIHMQPYGQLAASEVAGCLLAVQLRNAPTKRERRHFFKRMRRAMLSEGMAMSQRYGLCFVVPVQRVASATDRHVAVDWLVDQPQTKVVVINGIRPIFNYFTKPLDIAVEDDEPVTPEYRAGAERLVRWLVTWALIERWHAREAIRGHPLTSEFDISNNHRVGGSTAPHQPNTRAEQP